MDLNNTDVGVCIDIWEFLRIFSLNAGAILLIFGTVVGNSLVLYVSWTNPKLRRQTNWFIASLAVADLLVGSAIVPLTAVYKLNGRWPFGEILCQMWLASDVLLCTASNLNLAMIAIDRFISIKRPFMYAYGDSNVRVGCMILAAWVVSFCVALPPLIGWRPTSSDGVCDLSTDVGYVSYSACCSFFIPAIFIVSLYSIIFRTTKQRSRLMMQKMMARRFAIINSLPDCIIRHAGETELRRSRKSPKPHKRLRQLGRRITAGRITWRDSKSSPTSPLLTAENQQNSGKVTAADLRQICNIQLDKLAETVDSLETKNELNPINDVGSRTSSVSERSPIVSERSSNASQLTDERRTNSRTRENFHYRKSVENLRDFDTKILKLRRRERQAALLLGSIIACFLVCWLPFFTVYVIQALICPIPHLLMEITFFAGYFNSLLNPLLYGLFNKEYRTAFKNVANYRCK